MARFSARWTRRLVDAVRVVTDPPVRSGHVAAGRAQWHEVQVLKFVHQPVRAGPRPTWRCTSAARRRLLATLVEALLAWLADPDEEARAAPRLHDLVELRPRARRRPAAGPRGRRAVVDYVGLARRTAGHRPARRARPGASTTRPGSNRAAIC